MGNKAEEEAVNNGPAAESTAVDIENETTEADRMTLVRKQSKVVLKRQRARLNQKLKGSCLASCVLDVALVDTRGKWVDVSDVPIDESKQTDRGIFGSFCI